MKATTALLVALVFGSALVHAASAEDLAVKNELVVEATSQRTLLGGKGDDHCYCAASWWYNGKEYHGCSDVDSPGKPWCVVNPECGKCDGVKGHNLKWKYCPAPEQPKPQPPNCNCKPSFTYKKCTYTGCTTVDSDKGSWCVVYDSCDKYDGYVEGQKYKYCEKPSTPPVIPCTCLPSWEYKGCKHYGCSTVDSKKPWCMVNQDCTYPDGVTEGKKWKWCPAPEQPKPQPPKPNCDCLPSWEYKGCTYTTCTTVDSYMRPWCKVHPSCDKCSYTNGYKWKYCNTKPSKPVTPPVACTCKPSWTYKKCTYVGCVAVDSKTPWCVVNDDCPNPDGYTEGQKYKYCAGASKWWWGKGKH